MSSFCPTTAGDTGPHFWIMTSRLSWAALMPRGRKAPSKMRLTALERRRERMPKHSSALRRAASSEFIGCIYNLEEEPVKGPGGARGGVDAVAGTDFLLQ